MRAPPIIARIVAAIAAAGMLALAAWWIIGRPIAATTQAAQAKVDAKLGQAAGQAAVDAIPQLNERHAEQDRVTYRVQIGVNDVRKAADAGNEARATSDATLRALCVLDPLDPANADIATGAVLVDPHCQRFAGADASR